MSAPVVIVNKFKSFVKIMYALFFQLRLSELRRINDIYICQKQNKNNVDKERKFNHKLEMVVKRKLNVNLEVVKKLNHK
jgi:hypothetical protein